jgi:hypothetical protein
MRRIYRNDTSPITKEKQSIAHKGKKHRNKTKKLISQKLIAYWAKLPAKPLNNTKNTTEQIYGKKD